MVAAMRAGEVLSRDLSSSQAECERLLQRVTELTADVERVTKEGGRGDTLLEAKRWTAHLGCYDGMSADEPLIYSSTDFNATIGCFRHEEERVACHHLHCTIQGGELVMRVSRTKRVPCSKK